MIVGYIRVSSLDQNEARQLRALDEAGVEKTYLDKMSGKDFSRPAYQRMLKDLRGGDLLVVQSINRLGRNYREIQEQWRLITKVKGVDIRVLDMPLLDTRREKNLMGTFIADLVLQVLSFVAETERNNIRSRQAQGIAAARARGVHLGRRENPVPKNFDEWAMKYAKSEVSGQRAAKELGMPYTTFMLKAKPLRENYRRILGRFRTMKKERVENA